MFFFSLGSVFPRVAIRNGFSRVCVARSPAAKLFHTRGHCLLKLRHGAGAFQIVLLDLATVNRLAIALAQPMDQGLAGANTTVITVSRNYRPLLDALKQTLVLVE